MIHAWTFGFPVGVSTNHLYIGWANHRRLSKSAAAWRDKAILTVRQYATDQGERLALPDGQLAFWLDVFPPDDKREHDGDNLLKFTVDTVMAAFGELDPRVTEYHVWRHAPTAHPRLRAQVTRARNLEFREAIA